MVTVDVSQLVSREQRIEGLHAVVQDVDEARAIRTRFREDAADVRTAVEQRELDPHANDAALGGIVTIGERAADDGDLLLLHQVGLSVVDDEGKEETFVVEQVDRFLVPVAEPAVSAPRHRYDVVGPVCETTDLFARDRELPELKSGDLVAFLTAGAYGAVMSSAYNARPPAPEVLVKGGEWSIVRPRLSDDALIAFDRLPPWLEDQAR